MKKQNYYLLIFGLIILDQFTKRLFFEKSYEILSFIGIKYAENTGIAFGLFQGYNWLFVLISVIIIGACVYFFKEYPLPLSFIIAGALGNLIDRLFFGFVIDFIQISVWPIFNLADSFNTIGVILLVYLLYKEDKAYKQKHPRKN